MVAIAGIMKWKKFSSWKLTDIQLVYPLLTPVILTEVIDRVHPEVGNFLTFLQELHIFTPEVVGAT